jgi:hypothetical protein
MKEADDQVRRWLGAHFGVIDRCTAVDLGVTPRRIGTKLSTGEWVGVLPGVYRLVGVPFGAAGWLQAAVLAGGPLAVVSHQSAAWLWGLLDTPPEQPVVTVPVSRRLRTPQVRAVRTARLVSRPARRRGLPCTPVVRTLFDCAGDLGDGDPAAIDALVDVALARRLVRTADLVEAATSADGRSCRGGRPLRARLEVRGVTGAPHPSVLESHMSRLFRRYGLPEPKAEVDWGPNRRYRLDYAYPAVRLVVEVDGNASHMTPEKQRHDHRRGNALSRAGWTVLHYDWFEVIGESDRVAAEINQTYRALLAAGNRRPA